MRVNYYLKHYVDKDALVRLWIWNPHGHGMISKYTKDGKLDDTCRVEELLEGDHWLSQYGEEIIIDYMNDDDIPQTYRDSVNLVILVDECFN